MEANSFMEDPLSLRKILEQSKCLPQGWSVQFSSDVTLAFVHSTVDFNAKQFQSDRAIFIRPNNKSVYDVEMVFPLDDKQTVSLKCQRNLRTAEQARDLLVEMTSYEVPQVQKSNADQKSRVTSPENKRVTESAIIQSSKLIQSLAVPVAESESRSMEGKSSETSRSNSFHYGDLGRVNFKAANLIEANRIPKHQSEMMQESKVLRCTVCSTSFTTEKLLEDHLQSSHTKDDFRRHQNNMAVFRYRMRKVMQETSLKEELDKESKRNVELKAEVRILEESIEYFRKGLLQSNGKAPTQTLSPYYSRIATPSSSQKTSPPSSHSSSPSSSGPASPPSSQPTSQLQLFETTRENNLKKNSANFHQSIGAQFYSQMFPLNYDIQNEPTNLSMGKKSQSGTNYQCHNGMEVQKITRDLYPLLDDKKKVTKSQGLTNSLTEEQKRLDGEIVSQDFRNLRGEVQKRWQDFSNHSLKDGEVSQDLTHDLSEAERRASLLDLRKSIMSLPSTFPQSQLLSSVTTAPTSDTQTVDPSYRKRSIQKVESFNEPNYFSGEKTQKHLPFTKRARFLYSF